MKRLFLPILLAFTLAGCTVDLANFKYTPLGSEPVEIGTAYRVTPSEPWVRVTSDLDEENWVSWSPGKKLQVWLSFSYDLKDGDALYEHVDPDFPLFRSDMSSSEVMAFFKRTLEFREIPGVETFDLRPAAFGEVTGFRFEYSFPLPDGSPWRGTVLAAVIDKRLQLIRYAARPADYEMFLDDANRVMKSIQLQ